MILINTSKGEFFFEKPVFDYGAKKINLDIAKENLFLFKEILDNSNVKFLLSYGTLLGAIREGNFIEHDFDTDLIVLEEHRLSFLNLLFEFTSKGFIVGRYENDMISLIRKEEYIDVYFFKKHLFFYRKIDKYLTYSRFLEKTSTYNFLGVLFNIPKDYEGYLEHYYGKNWRTPIPFLHSRDFTFNQKIRIFLKKNFSKSYALLKSIKYLLNKQNNE